MAIVVTFLFAATAFASDWRTVEAVEAFPGSLSDIDTPNATSGGVSGTGSANKGSFATNAHGTMAVTFLKGLSDKADVVVGRSDDGNKWERFTIPDVGVRNSQEINRAATLVFELKGPGPQVAIDDTGDVCLVTMSGSELVTLWWPKDAHDASTLSRVATDVPIFVGCRMKMDTTVESFDLHCFDNTFYLITAASLDSSAGIQVFRLQNKTWVRDGKPLDGRRGTLAFDRAKRELYSGVESFRAKVGKYPSVYKWNAERKEWIELSTQATSGLREQYGITNYPGGSCPSVAVHDGAVYAFWWHKDSKLLQGAVYRDGSWQSCSKTRLLKSEYSMEYQDFESFGQNQGLYRASTPGDAEGYGLVAHVDAKNGDIAVLIDDGLRGLVIRDGRTEPMLLGRRSQSLVERAYTQRSPGRVSNVIPEVNQGFHIPHARRSGFEHTSRTYFDGERAFVQATIAAGSRGTDVFVFKFEPRPFRAMGAELDSSGGTLVVKSVAADSIASEAGIQVGDQIIWCLEAPAWKAMEFMGPPRYTAQQLIYDLRYCASSVFPIQVKRDGTELRLEAKIPPLKE